MRVQAVCFFIFILCSIAAKSQPVEKILSAEKIIELIPDRIKDFYAAEDGKSRVVKLGNIQYSLAEKNFTSGKKRYIKILLFDYNAAPIMYNQATKKFSGYKTEESDSLISRSVLMKDCTGWESDNFLRKNSQIMLGICDRYFLVIEGNNVSLEFLKGVLQTFDLEEFPK